MGKRRIDPEVWAHWAQVRREAEATMERYGRHVAAMKEAEARRKARLRRLTFGLLGRS